ncbi:Isochorismatase-like protein [Bombardia bombarda]|uniref:Isochorismatase-like protein n=1 Tax=Bombardia bombarda TaxID=252184 RepID=A0AA39TR11_9PEZI|nr:Isochorismatase-like protein [Bombardia bombarda]
MDHTALFVIDIQHDLALDPATRIPHADRIVSAMNKILTANRGLLARSNPETPSSTIVHVQHEETPEQGPLVRGSVAWESASLKQNDEGGAQEWLVSKTTRDTFESNPELAEKLRAYGVDKIIAFGVQSECCVESTCLGALAAGFDVTLLSGAHSTYDGADGKSAVEIEREVEGRLRERGVEVVEWEDVVAAWAREG